MKGCQKFPQKEELTLHEVKGAHARAHDTSEIRLCFCEEGKSGQPESLVQWAACPDRVIGVVRRLAAF